MSCAFLQCVATNKVVVVVHIESPECTTSTSMLLLPVMTPERYRSTQRQKNGRRVDKNALHMVLAERATTELKSKFQGRS